MRSDQLFAYLLTLISLSCVTVMSYIIGKDYRALQEANIAFSILMIWDESNTKQLLKPRFNDKPMGESIKSYNDTKETTATDVGDPFELLAKTPNQPGFYSLTDSETGFGVAFVVYPSAHDDTTDSSYKYRIELFDNPNGAYSFWLEDQLDVSPVWVSVHSTMPAHIGQRTIARSGTPTVSLLSEAGPYLTRPQLHRAFLLRLDRFGIHESDYRLGYRKLRARFPELSIIRLLVALTQSTAGMIAALGSSIMILATFFVWQRSRTNWAALTRW